MSDRGRRPPLQRRQSTGPRDPSQTSDDQQQPQRAQQQLQYTSTSPVPQVYHHSAYSSPPPIPQNSPNIHVPYPTSPHYGAYPPPNFQQVAYSPTTPMPMPPYYYSFGQPQPTMNTQYPYPPPEPTRSLSEPAVIYSEQQRRPGPSSMTSATYARMTYAAPMPYPYSMAPSPHSIQTLPPPYPPGASFPVQAAQGDTGREYWYGAFSPNSISAPPDLGREHSGGAGSVTGGTSMVPTPTATPMPRYPPTPSRVSTRSILQDNTARATPTAQRGAMVSSESPSELDSSPLQLRGGGDSQKRTNQPQMPADRSEYVMWVGNIPSDCDSAELERFFKSIQWPSSQDIASSDNPMQFESEPPRSGVVSVFLISQSNCAFVNYDSEARLLNAVAKCNGVAIRPDDPKCIKLVCRVRKREEDNKAGVGAQRGVRMHTAWVQQQKQKNKASQGEVIHTSPPAIGSVPASGGPEPPSPLEHANTSPITIPPDGSSGSISFASTNSSFLATYFPQRYFILKSLTLEDLKLSVEKKMWATQAHNEEVLDQAYRTSQDVFLIFGANKTGEFFGYARMSGPILKTRSGSAAGSAPASSPEAQPVAPVGSVPAVPAVPAPDSSSSASVGSQISSSNRFLLTPGRVLRESPIPVSPTSPNVLRTTSLVEHSATAPPELGEPYRRLSLTASPAHASTYEERPTFQLDRSAPRRAVRVPEAVTEDDSLEVGEVTDTLADVRVDDSMIVKPPDTAEPDADLETVPERDVERGIKDAHDIPLSRGDLALVQRPQPRPVQKHTADSDPGASPPDAAVPGRSGWGTSFPITWIRVQGLPFTKTRHLRNPWNADREVKVSRDGTELEPTIGRALLAQWDNLAIGDNLPSGSSGQKRGGTARGVIGRRI